MVLVLHNQLTKQKFDQYMGNGGVIYHNHACYGNLSQNIEREQAFALSALSISFIFYQDI
jgi:hypothetical protein